VTKEKPYYWWWMPPEYGPTDDPPLDVDFHAMAEPNGLQRDREYMDTVYGCTIYTFWPWGSNP
jgi:hypothetical protein